jgi:hypothetical protein
MRGPAYRERQRPALRGRRGAEIRMEPGGASSGDRARRRCFAGLPCLLVVVLKRSDGPTPAWRSKLQRMAPRYALLGFDPALLGQECLAARARLVTFGMPVLGWRSQAERVEQEAWLSSRLRPGSVHHIILKSDVVAQARSYPKPPRARPAPAPRPRVLCPRICPGCRRPCALRRSAHASSARCGASPAPARRRRQAPASNPSLRGAGTRRGA